MNDLRAVGRTNGPGARPDPTAGGPATDLDVLLDRAVAGLPRGRRRKTRRELAGYVEDAFTDLLAQGMDAVEAVESLQDQFGDPEAVAAGFRSLPPPRWARGMRTSAGPMSAVVLGLVLGLALVQMRGPANSSQLVDAALEAEPVVQAQKHRLHVREVDALQAPAAVMSGAADAYPVATRLGVPRPTERVLEPSVKAPEPAWLPDGYDPGRWELFLTPSLTTKYFPDQRGNRSGIVVEVLHPDRSTVFQVKERHVFPIQVGTAPGFYIDGEWEVRGPQDEQSAPGTWRTDRSHTLLFARDDLLVLVAGPADLLDLEGLLRIARSVR